MRDLARQVRSALTTYLERGRAAILSLSAGRHDEATEILRLRTAAFHNFRAVDVMALKSGSDLAKDPAVLAMWDEIRAVEKELAAELEIAAEKTRQLYSKIRETRAKIGRYRSGRSEKQTVFAKTV